MPILGLRKERLIVGLSRLLPMILIVDTDGHLFISVFGAMRLARLFIDPNGYGIVLGGGLAKCARSNQSGGSEANGDH